MQAQQWDRAFEDDLSVRRPIEEQLTKSLNFIQEHETLLREIENATLLAMVETPQSQYRHIQPATQPQERVFPQDLILTDNDLLHKVLTVLVYLCDEINELNEIARNKLFDPLLMFGYQPAGSGNGEDEVERLDGKKEKMTGALLPTLQEISNFIDRCYSVSINTIQQLSSLISGKEQLYRSSFQNVHLEKVFTTLGELFTTLITFDLIIQQNEVLKSSWSKYKYMISMIRNDPSAFQTTETDIASYEKMLVSIDFNIMSGQIFKGCIEQNYEINVDPNTDAEIAIRVRDNDTFMNEMLICIKLILDSALNNIGKPIELKEREEVIGGYALYALYRQLVPPRIPPDSKMQKFLWSSQKIVPMVVVGDKTVWYPAEFIQAYCPYDLKKPDPPVAPAFRKTSLQQFDATFSSKVGVLIAQINSWFVLAESRLQPSLRYEESVRKAIDLRGSIILKGLNLASRASYLAKYSLVMHAELQVPMTKSILLDIAALVEILKGIEYTFRRKQSEIAEAKEHMLTQLASACVELLKPIRSKLESSRKLDSSRLDMLTSLLILQTALSTSESFTYSRQVVIEITTVMITHSSHFNDAETSKLKAFIKRLCYLANLQSNLFDACNTQFLYHHRETLFPIAVTSLYQNPITLNVNRFQYLLTAYADGVKICGKVTHDNPEVYIDKYKLYITELIKEEIIKPVCRDIETDLRLHIHTKHLTHMQSTNPKDNNERPLKPFLNLAPLHVLGVIINVRDEICSYLDRTFYNLTTVALHDWRTYSDMRSLAREKYGIELLDNYLPMGSLDQGLDVLQIMRNIHVFVGRFTYNMNTQQFIEFRPDKASKHINTIKIQSIAASLRQHGLGVLNTTVNFTYQFLAQKFNIFSQFLFDDYIKAHLSREYRWYKKHKNDPEIKNQYPHDRALNFVRDIRKLGVNEQGKSFLDQFRILITEIGNALGYVRMVRSASMYYCSEAVKFLPDIDKIISFEAYAGKGTPPPEPLADGTVPPQAGPSVVGAGLSDETVRAGKNLDRVITTLVDNFSEGSDYFKVLVNVFQSVLLTPDNDHLRTFFMIVPSMCLSWVEASLQAKESMYKATRNVSREMYFTDDGFAMGLSYCLAILKQTNKSHSLHWFDTVSEKYKHDLAAHQQQQAARALKEKKKAENSKRKSSFMGSVFSSSKKSSAEAAEDEEDEHQDFEEVHSLQLTAKRLEAMRRENDQLFYSMSGAAIFFKRTDVDI